MYSDCKKSYALFLLAEFTSRHQEWANEKRVTLRGETLDFNFIVVFTSCILHSSLYRLLKFKLD